MVAHWGRVALMRTTWESPNLWVGVRSAAAAVLASLLFCHIGSAAGMESAGQQQDGTVRPSGFALMGNAEKISRIANGQATRDFLTTRDVQPYIEYFERQGWYVGESNNFFLAIDQESMLIYGALIQAEILKLVASKENFALPNEELSDVHRRFLIGRLSHTEDPMEALVHGDGAVTLSPRIYFTISDGDTTANVSLSPGLGEELPAPVERSDQPKYEHDGYVPPRNWDYRVYDVLTNSNARRSHDAYMSVLRKYMDDIDEQVQEQISEITRMLEPWLNSFLANLRISPADLRNGHQLPAMLQMLLLQDSLDPAMINNPSLTKEGREGLIENGSLQAIRMTLHVSAGRKGDTLDFHPSYGIVITIPVRD